MIEIILMIWGAIWLLWVLALLVAGEKERILSFSFGYAIFPPCMIVGASIGMLMIAIAPIIIIFSDSAKAKWEEKMNSGDKVDKAEMHISDTGRVWLDPNEVVKSEKFQRQSEAVGRMREEASKDEHE